MYLSCDRYTHFETLGKGALSAVRMPRVAMVVFFLGDVTMVTTLTPESNMAEI